MTRGDRDIGTAKGILLAGIVLCLFLWIAFFTAGLLVNTADYRREIAESDYRCWKLSSWVIVLTCFTPTNVAILCGLAGLLGALGDQVTLGADSEGKAISDRSHPFLSALVRGFFVYIVLISGTFVLLPDPFPDPTLAGSPIEYSDSALRELYIRLAGLVSLASFAVSYNPRIFTSTLRKIANVGDPNAGSGKTPPQQRETTPK